MICKHGKCCIIYSSFDGGRHKYCKCFKGWSGNQCQIPLSDDAGSPANHEGHHEEAHEDHLGPSASYKVAAIAIGVVVAVEVVTATIVLLVMKLRSKKKEQNEQVKLAAAVNES